MAKEMKPWGFELEEYIREGEPERAARADAWQTAIGLQAVDGLEVSEYLVDTAKQNIEGKIDASTVRKRIESYYEERRALGIYEDDTEEADLVSQRASELLMDGGFQFSPSTLMAIHEHLFRGILKKAGTPRDFNISKREWVLKGESVQYAAAKMIWSSLKYDFDQEEDFSYSGASLEEAIRHIAKFVSGIWQIHPFGEGNTRTTAIFTIKYLNSMGFGVDNTAFKNNSWYFRNALVRANYNDLPHGISATLEPLELFFSNLLTGTHHALKNRYLHVDYADAEDSQSEADDPKCNNCTLDCTLEELAILRCLAVNPKMTQKELADQMDRSERTIKSRTVDLQERGLLARENGKRNGQWIVLADLGE